MGLPNSYTMTKHMAEGLVADMHAAGALPAAIVRPSIIGCCAYDPAPGYIGNAAGLTSAILAIVSGEYTPVPSTSEQHRLWRVHFQCITLKSCLAAAIAVSGGHHGCHWRGRSQFRYTAGALHAGK